ncbi:MAG: hypothetical protein JXA33_09200 [Anaerolineae bacterium]|nr:hypothetical protein [Anaerolineae bacterium]
MLTELKTFFWLQIKLTLSMFRSQRANERFRALFKILQLVSFIFTIPMFIIFGIGLAVFSAFLTPAAVYELAMLINNFLFLVWLLLPASYNSQIVERFEMSRLFVYPVRFRTLVIGSTLISLMTMTGIWSACLIAGEVLGMIWHRPLGLPLYLLGALPLFAILVLTGRIMDDLFDLVASDRRLRALVLAVLTLPFMLVGIGQAFIQNVIQNYDRIAFLQRLPLQDLFHRLEYAANPSEFLEILAPSRLLVWLPAGWSTAGMGLAVTGAWGQALAFLGGSLLAVSLLLWLHAGITRRLMQGAALHIGAERVRSQNSFFQGRLPGPATFWALLQKDWIYLWRSPGPRRMIFSAVAASLPTLTLLLQGELREEYPDILPLALASFSISLMSMIINMAVTSNYFGLIDREGFGTLALSGVDRRQMIVAANLTSSLLAMVLYAIVLTLITIFTRTWFILPLGLYMGLCMQIGGAPVYTLAAILAPYRTQLKFSAGTHQRGNIWGMVAWLIAALPVVILFVLPFLLWKPGLWLTLPLAALYSGGAYALTLAPLARLLQRREHSILEAVRTE